MTAPPVSTAPSVIAYLLGVIRAQLDTDTNGSEILLAMADPGNGTDVPPEIVTIGSLRRTVKPETFIGSGGPDWLDESYTIDGMVSVETGSSDTGGALTIQIAQIGRAWQLLGYVETAIRDDPSLGGLVNIAYPKSTVQSEPVWTAVGLLVEISFQIYCDVLN